MILKLMPLALLLSTSSVAQMTDVNRTIEVTGQAERMIEPDEIIFTIQIEEYWEEEFEGKKWEDYKTKVEIEKIESSLMEELTQNGISIKNITLNQAGNYWRQRGKDFLVNKSLDISLKSFEKANKLANALSTRGIKNMAVTRLKHKKLEQYTMEVKKEALLAARKKAETLVNAIDKELGEAITILEVDRNMGIIRPQQVNYDMRTSAMVEAGGINYENFRQIKLTAEMRVVFLIK